MNNVVVQPQNPFMTDAFARVYEETGERITGQAARAALELVGSIGPGQKVLDLGAGTGALAIPAARLGALVSAVDIAPGMIRRLSKNVAGLPNVDALEMDGTNLDFPEGHFDATFSVFGLITFQDWRKGLNQQFRVTRPGGKGCVVTWGNAVGGGPFEVMATAISNVFPDRIPMPKPEAFVALGNTTQFISEMESAGFEDVSVTKIDCYWEGPSGEAYLALLRELHNYMRPYQTLSLEEKALVDAEIAALTSSRAVQGKIKLSSPVLIAIGQRPLAGQ